MPWYLCYYRTGSDSGLEAIQAANLTAAETAVKDKLAKGLSINKGQREAVDYAIVLADAQGRVTPT